MKGYFYAIGKPFSADLAFVLPCRLFFNNWKRDTLKEEAAGKKYRVQVRRVSRKRAAYPKSIFTFASLDENVSKLKGRILEWLQDPSRNLHSNSKNNRFIVGVVGVPGSGKTTLALRTASSLNSINPNTCIVVPMDGFHYPKQTLDQMEHAAEAHARRGAPWTFDSHGFVEMIEKIRNNEAVLLPWFDHHKGDPDNGAVYVDKTIPIVLVEGNYLLLPDKPWSGLSHILDEIWYLDCDISEAMNRVFRRMVNEVGMSPGEASFRVAYNDRKNAELILSFKSRADVILDSN